MGDSQLYLIMLTRAFATWGAASVCFIIAGLALARNHLPPLVRAGLIMAIVACLMSWVAEMERVGAGTTVTSEARGILLSWATIRVLYASALSAIAYELLARPPSWGRHRRETK